MTLERQDVMRSSPSRPRSLPTRGRDRPRLLREDFLDFSRLAVIWIDLQGVLQLFLGHVEIIGFQVSHSEVIVISGIFRIPLYCFLGFDGLLEQINRCVINALLVISPAERVGGIR